MKVKGGMQGEGDRESARRYRKHTGEHVESSDVEDESRRAEPGSAREGEALGKADEIGRSRAREEDSAIVRDYSDAAGD
ncbi:MAG TPA: hypothetical protein VM616_07065 [Gammaproteobacteria bacterium]|nr:hypothetical protein [Gammaproteobacteria bacterium]